jgi:hypothetical protein
MQNQDDTNLISYQEDPLTLNPQISGSIYLILTL